MTSLLTKLFIKNANDVSSSEVRAKYGMLSGCVGIVINIFLCIIKMICAFLTGSVSIAADSFNNLSDAGSSIVTLIGFKMSAKPADKDHPFGHGRVEYICALVVSLAVLLMGFELLKTSVGNIFSGESIIFSFVSVIILIVSILFKLWMYFFNSAIAKKINSTSMLAAAADSISDVLATSAVLLGLLIFKFTNINADAYIGILVSCLILYAGYSTIKDSLTPLLGEPTNRELTDEIKNIVLSHKSVIGIHDIIVHNYGVGRFMISLHAEVRADCDILEIHDEIDLIEKHLSNHFNCNAVIHMDPIETDNQAVNEERAFVSNCVKSINPSLSIHDFRMVRGSTHTNLIFDLCVPFDFPVSDSILTDSIDTAVKQKNPNYYTVINIDKIYTENGN